MGLLFLKKDDPRRIAGGHLILHLCKSACLVQQLCAAKLSVIHNSSEDYDNTDNRDYKDAKQAEHTDLLHFWIETIIAHQFFCVNRSFQFQTLA